MTEYRFTFEMNHRREKAESPGVGMADTLAKRSGTVILPMGNNTVIPIQVGPYTAERIQSAVLFCRGGQNANTRLETWRDSIYWGITTTAHAVVANGAGDQTVDLQVVGPARQRPPVVVAGTGPAERPGTDAPHLRGAGPRLSDGA